MKILNLYAGIGGNRKLWDGDIEVTAVEINPKIVKIYKDFFPQDKVIVGDAHQYLLEHYKEFDFIWSSPPCPTHSRFNFLFKEQECKKPRFPDMKLYEEIILLKHWFNGKFVVENVKSYYEPLIKPQESGNHFFWTNFLISNLKKVERGIRTKSIERKEKDRGIDLSKFNISKEFRERIINNMVFPELALHIFKMAFKDKQEVLKI
jgi:DNA (cytosine-5)-methyltransferase 1